MPKIPEGIAVLSVDPGFANLGFAVVRHHADERMIVLEMGVISTAPEKRKGKLKTEDQFSRLCSTSEKVLRIAKEHDVKAICFESLSIPKATSKQNAIMIGHPYGMIAMLAAMYSWPWVMVSPRDVKIALLGRASASKEEIQGVVEELLLGQRAVEDFKSNVAKGKQNHGWDALAVYVAASKTSVMKALGVYG